MTRKEEDGYWPEYFRQKESKFLSNRALNKKKQEGRAIAQLVVVLLESNPQRRLPPHHPVNNKMYL